MKNARPLLMFGLLSGFMALAIAAAEAKEVTSAVSSASTLEVTADQSLEWYQDKKLYVARGNAKAVKGDLTIEADILAAHQRETEQKQSFPAKTTEASALSGDLDQLTAEGNVRITDPRQKIFGSQALYDFDRRHMRVTGDHLKYMTASEVVTARDSLEYDEDQSLAIARGKAVAVYEKTPGEKRQIEADVLSAKFVPSSAGEKELSQVFADGSVTILTKTDVSRGDHAVYDVKKNRAILTGNVRITRGSTQLAGDRAEVDFTTGSSRLLNTGKGARVKAFILPQSGKGGAL